MRVSRDKVIHLSHLIVNALDDNKVATFLTDRNNLRMEIANTILDELSVEEEIGQEVQRTLRSYKRKIVEGSREWDVMYQKTFEQEMKKHGRMT